MTFHCCPYDLDNQIVKMHLNKPRLSKFSQIYKVKNNICTKHIANLFQRTDTKYPLTNNTLIKYDYTWRKAFIKYIGPKVRNRLPKGIRDLPKLFVFKQHIRQLDLNSLLAEAQLAVLKLHSTVVRNKHTSISLRSSHVLVNSFLFW